MGESTGLVIKGSRWKGPKQRGTMREYGRGDRQEKGFDLGDLNFIANAC